MKHPLLPFLALALLPLCAPAQTAPPVNLQVGQVLQLPVGARPVDVAVIAPGGGVMQVGLEVLAQGTNRKYTFGPTRTGFGRNFFSDSLAVPLCIVPVPEPGWIDNFLVLTADGNVQRWRGNSNLNGNFRRFGPPVPLRGGLPCALTDRLQMGRFATGAGLGSPGDLVCWSDGPQPSLARVRNTGFGTYQPLAPAPALALFSLSPGGATSLAYFDLRPNNTSGATLFRGAPTDTAGRYTYWRELGGTGSTNANWFQSVRYAQLPLGQGPCRALAAAQLNGGGTLEFVVLRRAITVYPMPNPNEFSEPRRFTPGTETYALLPVPIDVRLADLNGDQRPEMLVLGDDGTLNVFENTSRVPGSTALFNPLPYVLPTGPDPATIRVADYDDDGDPDVLVPCRGDGTVRLFRNGLRTLGTARAAAARPALALYPNPATGTVQVRWDAARGPATAPAALLDALGRPVRSWPAVPAAGTTLDVAGLPPGVYALRVAGTGTQRLVLE